MAIKLYKIITQHSEETRRLFIKSYAIIAIQILRTVFNRLDNLETTMEKMQVDMTDGFSKINLTLENEIRPMLQLLAENYMPAAVKYSQSLDEQHVMKEDIELLKKVVFEHSEQIQLIS